MKKRKLMEGVPRIPYCHVSCGSSWHDPVACAYPENHPGKHSWATIPALSPLDRIEELGAELSQLRLRNQTLERERETYEDTLAWSRKAVEREKKRAVEAEARNQTMREALDEAQTSVHGQAVDDALAYVEMRDLEVLDPHDPLLVLADTVNEVRAALSEPAEPRKYTYLETPTPPLNNRTAPAEPEREG